MNDHTTDEIESMIDEATEEINRLKRDRKTLENELSERRTSGRVTPETFKRVAEAVYNGKSFSAGHRFDNYENGVRENGFVHESMLGRGAIIGIRQGEQYIIAKLQKRTERLGRGDPRIKETENEYVSATFAECVYAGPLNDVDRIQAAFDNGERIGSGSMHGSGPTSIEDVLDETFKYYTETTNTSTR